MKDKIKSALVGLEKVLEGFTLKTTKLSTCLGESRVLIVRGTKRAGFEFELEIHWTATRGGEQADGTVKINEISETSIDDFEMDVTVSSGPSTARKAVLLLQTDIEAAFKSICETMVKEW